MKLITSKQVGVSFVHCGSPITIDKRADWGSNADNLQHGPNGGFLKMTGLEVSHLVQPNADRTAPIGWRPGSAPGLYDKDPIFVSDEVLEPGTTKEVVGLDGTITYEIKEPSRLCYNDLSGEPNPNDAWVQTEKNLVKNYNL